MHSSFSLSLISREKVGGAGVGPRPLTGHALQCEKRRLHKRYIMPHARHAAGWLEIDLEYSDQLTEATTLATLGRVARA